jgi:hypothetical protein
VLAAELVSFHLPVFESFPKHPLSWCEPLPQVPCSLTS